MRQTHKTGRGQRRLMLGLSALTGGMLGCSTGDLFDYKAEPFVMPDPRDADTKGPFNDEAGTPADSGPSMLGCEGTEPDPALGVFASPQGKQVGECGTAALPCKSITQAMGLALISGRHYVYLASGRYEEDIALQADLTVQGGWEQVGAKWRRDCTTDRAERTVIASTSTTGLRAEYAGRSVLEALTVTTTPTGTPGASRYAIFARGANTQLVLQEVNARASKADAGSAGTAGRAPLAPVGTCAPSTGVPGVPGKLGNAAAVGVFGLEGYVPADGSEGGAAASGQAGSAARADCGFCEDFGASATCTVCRHVVNSMSCMISNTIVTTTTSVETTIECTPHQAQKVCMSGGLSGCGGGPGSAGKGGKGGGSSIALFVADANVTVIGGSLVAEQAGAGGEGGAGSDGAMGSPGTPGEERDCYSCQVRGEACPSLPAKVRGTKGGDGGRGGRGGDGGQGADGFSFALFKLGNASVDLSPLTTLSCAQPNMPASLAGGVVSGAGLCSGPRLY